jgi:hypothetical protein
MNISLCNRKFSPLQRRSIALCGACMALTASLTLVAHDLFKEIHPSVIVVYLLAVLSTIPVIGIIVAVGRYLARESDEFVRTIVVQSILWGLGITFVVDTFLGGLWAYPSVFRLIPILNIDLFWVAGAIALRVQLWRNR